MSVWGSGVDDNDAYNDIYDAFFELYNSGKSAEDASNKIKDTFSEYFSDDDDANSSLFALAYAQWETKSLESKILKEVNSIIKDGLDVDQWRSKGVTDDEIAKIDLNQKKFLNEIESPRKFKKRRRKRKVEFRSNKLIELNSPDNKKTLIVTERYSAGSYVNTSGLITWPCFGDIGGTVFHYKGVGAKVNAIWNESDTVTITVDDSVEFTQKNEATRCYGESVVIEYTCA